MSTTADGIAYRLVRELEDLIELAGNAMREANADGSEYEVEEELASARLAVESYEKFCAETKGDSPAHACELNRAYDGSCLICGNAAGGAVMTEHTVDLSQCSQVTQTLIRELIERDQHGLAKYGVSLDREDLDLVEWLQHQKEELLDGAGYCEAAIRKLVRGGHHG